MLSRPEFSKSKHTTRKGMNFEMYQKMKRRRQNTEKSQNRKNIKINLTNKKNDLRSKSNKITRKPIKRYRKVEENRKNMTFSPKIGRNAFLDVPDTTEMRSSMFKGMKKKYFGSQNPSVFLQNPARSRINVDIRRKERRRRINLRLGNSLSLKKSSKASERKSTRNSSFSIRVAKYGKKEGNLNKYLDAAKQGDTNFGKFEEVTPHTRASSNFDTPKTNDPELDFDQLNSKSNFFSIKKKGKRRNKKKKTFNELANEVKKLRDERVRTEDDLGDGKHGGSIFSPVKGKKFQSLFEMRRKKKDDSFSEWKAKKEVDYFRDLFKGFDPLTPIKAKHVKLKEYLTECLTVIEYFKSERILPPLQHKIEDKALILKKKMEDKGKKMTLVFDLDETLIHCVENRNKGFDISLNIFNSYLGKNIKVTPYHFLTLVKTYFNLRPHLTQCLETLSQRFELMIFTASQPHYANKIIDYIDPKNRYFSHRLFRNDCIELQPNLFTKDLRIIKNRDPSKMILIDNALYSYYFTPKQAIPILPFTDSKMDDELLKLTDFFMNVPLEAELDSYCYEALKQRKVKNCKNLRDFVTLYSSQN